MATKTKKKTVKKDVKSAKQTKNKKQVAKKPIKKSKLKDITEVVYDYETACKHLGRKALLPDVSMLPEKHQKAVIAFIVLMTIYEAWNEGWVPDFTNGMYDKYYLWIYVKKDDNHPSGFGLSDSHCNYAFSYSNFGSRLYLKSSRLVLRAGEILKPYIMDYYFIPKDSKVAIKVKKAKK